MRSGARALSLALISALVAACGSALPVAPASSSTGVSSSVQRGPSDFTGDFMTDQRPYWMGWLSLTQSGTSVSGSMLTVEPDGKGSTKATNNSVTGTTDGGSALTLTTGSFLGTAGASFTGRRSNDTITLSYADKTGQLQSAIYRATSQATFNEVLAKWQGDLASTKSVADQAAAAKKAQDERTAALVGAVRDRSDNLQSYINQLASGTRNRKADIASAQSSLKAEQSDLTQLQNDYATLQKDAREPLDNYGACVAVRYDFNTSMGYDFNTALAYDRSAYAKVAQTIDTNLGAVDLRLAETVKAALELSVAIGQSPVTVTGFLAPGDEKATMDEYRTTADTVKKQLADLRTQDASIYASAQNVMNQGQALWNTVKANHKCP